MLDDRAAATMPARFGDPNAPWLRLITPEPLQVAQTFGLVPGRAPPPWQLVHGAGLVSRSGMATPLVASRKSRSVSVSRSCRGAADWARLRAPSEQPAEQVADVGPAVLPPAWPNRSLRLNPPLPSS
jgi:hypothetical protein